MCAEANEKASLDMELALTVKQMLEKDPDLKGKFGHRQTRPRDGT